MIKGLPQRYVRPIVITLLILVSAAGLARAAVTPTIIYSTDFSSDPGWVTNNPYTNHWDEEMGMFHYYLRDSTNTFVYKKVPYAGESFELDFDLLPLKTDFQSSFRLGLGNREMLINQGTTIFSEFENGMYGDIMWLRVINTQNQRREVSSYSQSYGGPPVRFTDGTAYHVALDYDREDRTAGIAINFLSNRTSFWGYTLSTISSFGIMDRIYLSTIGDFENPNAVAEGYIDNVTMRLTYPSMTTAAPPPPSSRTVVPGGETSVATPTLSSIPVPIGKSTPIPVFASLSALGIAATLALARRK
jgi:hypothetical protein